MGALALFNAAVAFFGNSHVPLLSPFFLEEKAQALGHYAVHRAGCLFKGHEPLAAHVAEAGRRHRLPRGLLEAVVQAESSGRVHSISRTGAMGPGQLMPGTAKLLDVDDPFDEARAVDGSARYLAQQLRRYRGNVALALAAYNAGPGNVSDRVPQNGETEHYVRKVLRLYEANRAR